MLRKVLTATHKHSNIEVKAVTVKPLDIQNSGKNAFKMCFRNVQKSG